MKRLVLFIAFAAGLTAGVLMLRTCATTEPFATRSFESMGTTVSVTVRQSRLDEATRITREVFDDLNFRMSEWQPGSPLSRVNASAGVQAEVVPEDLFDLIRRGIDIGEMTNGAFDISWAALWGVWEFNAAAPTIPDADLIEDRRAFVDFHAIDVEGDARSVYLPHEGMQLGLGGIGKGHALDVAATALLNAGIDDVMLVGGGQTCTRGSRGDRPWRIGIRDPRGDAGSFFAYLEPGDASVSTSGDYERFFTVDGVRYHHIIDPRTGWPAQSGVRSATVVSRDAVLADALSTAVVVMGVEAGMRLIESQPDVEAVLVDGAGTIQTTSGLADRVSIVRPPTP
jgi:thiamine biosynthesis lipoprotein